MVDTHAHLSLCEPPAAELLATAAEAGVTRVLEIGLGEDSNPVAVELAGRHAEIFAAVGRHPNSAAGFDDDAAAALLELSADPGVRAIGETGLDFYRDGAPRDDQRRAFAAQIEVAAERKLPLVIHVRDREGETKAVDEVFDTLAGAESRFPVILHCFSAPQRVSDAAERGWYCSFAGNVTYPRAEDLRAAAAKVPDDLLLVETDSPYLAPQSMRGKRNQPAHVVETARQVAEARGVAPDEVEALVEANAERLFRW
jgi:TatD DNase family protein